MRIYNMMISFPYMEALKNKSINAPIYPILLPKHTERTTSLSSVQENLISFVGKYRYKLNGYYSDLVELIHDNNIVDLIQMLMDIGFMKSEIYYHMNNSFTTGENMYITNEVFKLHRLLGDITMPERLIDMDGFYMDTRCKIFSVHDII